MNNQQQQQLEKLRKKWNLDCKIAVKNKVSYVLRRSRSDYLRVVGSDKGLDRYQAEVLNDISGVGTHRQVAIFERNRVADIIRDAFSTVEPDTVTGMIGVVVVEEILGDAPRQEVAVSTVPEMIVTRSDETIENFNPMSGVVPGPVSAMSAVSLQKYQPMLETKKYVVDFTSPTNIYTRDMLKNMGLLKKVRSLNWKKVGAVTGTMSAVALVSTSMSLSAYATTDSGELWQRAHTAYVETSNTQSLKVSANAAPAEVHDRMKDLYRPDMIWPTVDGSAVTISSGFGYRVAPCPTCSSDHRGLDMNPGYGTEVYSSTSGTVVSVGWDGSLGWQVTVHDSGNRQYVYGHMIADSTPGDVVVGAEVKQGQIIGYVGSTGTSTGAHLHFEVVEDGIQIDPYPELLKYAH